MNIRFNRLELTIFSGIQPCNNTLFTYPGGETHLQFGGHNNLVIATAFHPGGGWLASAGGDHKEILLWRADTGELLSRLEGKGRTIFTVAFSRDGRFIGWGQTSDYSSINDRGPLEQRFDLKERERIYGGIATPQALRAQPRIGKLSLSIKRDDAPCLLVEQGGKRLCTIERNAADGYWHSAYTLSPDGQRILSGGQNGELRLYTTDGKTLARLLGHTGEIKAVAISADGNWALSGSNDQTVNRR